MKLELPFFKKKPTIPSEQILATTIIEAKDIIAPSFIEVKMDHLKVGEKLFKSFFIFSYPKYLTAVWLAPIINLDQPLDISFHIHPIDTGTVLKKLENASLKCKLS